MTDNLTAVDLYCGGGGFSEGFRQAGFEITHAVDWSDGAIETYELNVPDGQETEVLQRSLLDNIDREELPSGVPENIDVLTIDELPDNPDVVIGSPPCTEFSRSKKGGNGDKEKGKGAVERYFELVGEMNPEYYIMENVPNSKTYVKEAFRNIGQVSLEGDLDEYLEVLDCSEYSTPQRRNRLFFGDYPKPEPVEKDAPTLGDIIDWYQSVSKKSEDDIIDDPLYPVSIPKSELTDQFYQPYLTEREAKEIRLKKTDHSYYGRMSFPENFDECSRTVVASDRTIARETLVIRDEENTPKKDNREWSSFRKPTIREIATLQGFPITYQFEGRNKRAKWQRVGDAVPPTVAYCIAKAIQADAGVTDVGDSPQVDVNVKIPEVNLNNSGTRSRRQMRISRPFSHHVPYDNKREFRVDLTTTSENLPEHPLSNLANKRVNHPVKFQVKLNKGYAKTHEEEILSIRRIKELVSILKTQRNNLETTIRMFLVDINDELREDIPDATTLQATRTFRKDWDYTHWDDRREYYILNKIASYPDDAESGLVDKWFPYEEFKNDTIELGGLMGGTELPIRVLMKLMAIAYVAHKLNYCSKWVRRNPEQVYLPDDIDREEVDFKEDPECKSVAPLDGCIEERFRKYSGQSEPDSLFGISDVNSRT